MDNDSTRCGTGRHGPARSSNPIPSNLRHRRSFDGHENELASGISDALAEMEQQSAHLGAEAVVGVDIDYETVGSNMLMVSASGTAVKLG
jgi:uncharacterized protein YbjQ (UPF0145 family)